MRHKIGCGCWFRPEVVLGSTPGRLCCGSWRWTLPSALKLYARKRLLRSAAQWRLCWVLRSERFRNSAYATSRPAFWSPVLAVPTQWQRWALHSKCGRCCTQLVSLAAQELPIKCISYPPRAWNSRGSCVQTCPVAVACQIGSLGSSRTRK